MNADNPILISVICPVYNEEKYIQQVLDFFLESKPLEKEIIFADGVSTDKTKLIIESYAAKHSNIFLIPNENKYSSFGLNLCIQKARGKFIARIDAHTSYPPDYFENCLSVYKQANAANIGGSVISKGNNKKSEAIALAMSSVAGVGNSGFRTKIADEYTNTVPFGFWEKKLFDEIGLFDMAMKKNQDDEFNFRTIASGKKIFLSSKIISTYFVRDSFSKLFYQYFDYGFYKPLVFKKTGAGYSLRHFIPALFVIYLILILLMGWWIPILFVPLVGYLFLLTLVGISKTGDLLQILFFVYSCFLLHTGYGTGFITGIFKWIL